MSNRRNYLELKIFGFEADAQGWGLAALVTIAAFYYFQEPLLSNISVWLVW